MTRELIVAGEVAAEIERINAWWADHRDKAPGLFLDELESAFRKIVALPQIGKPHPRCRARVAEHGLDESHP